MRKGIYSKRAFGSVHANTSNPPLNLILHHKRTHALGAPPAPTPPIQQPVFSAQTRKMSPPREVLPSVDEGLYFAVMSYNTSSYGTKVVKLKIDQIYKDSIKIRPVNDEHINNLMQIVRLNG